MAPVLLVSRPHEVVISLWTSPPLTEVKSVSRGIRMQKTRIICTIGPATESYEMLEKMYEAGMNIARLNMSHGDHDSHAKVIQHIKTLNKKVRFPIPILLDTQGPAIRTGDLSNDLDLRQGDIVSVTTRGPMDVEESSIHIDYADLLEAVNIGDKITVDNGLINFEVLEKQERLMRCRVVDGGLLKSCLLYTSPSPRD